MGRRVRDPNVEEVSEIKLNPFRHRGWHEILRGDRTPGSLAPVIIFENGERVAQEMRWGLIPAWSESDLLDHSTYNARRERISEAATYRSAWRRRRRCLIPAEGFYERKRYFYLRDAKLMMLAGLWDEWKNPIGGVVRSYTIITTEPNELVGRVHNRMPVIIARDVWARWLGEEAASEDHLKALLTPYPADLVDTSLPPGTKPKRSAAQDTRQLRLL